MKQVRANSSPDLIFPSATKNQPFDEGVAANVKLLLKLIQDHKIACDQEKTDHRRMLRVATMMTILENVRERISKCQSFGNKKVDAELRRCNTDLRRSPAPNKDGKRPPEDDDKEGLRRDLAASLAAQKRLQMMCSSLGKEKQIMTAELSKKVHELSEMEEIINNLKEQNETLRQKVKDCFSEHRESRGGGVGGGEPAVVLQERNKVLSDQLVRSIGDYRSIKRRLKVAQEENVLMHDTIDEMGVKVVRSLERVKSLKEGMSSHSPVNVQEEIAVLQRMFEGFKTVVDKHDKKLGQYGHPSADIGARKASILA